MEDNECDTKYEINEPIHNNNYVEKIKMKREYQNVECYSESDSINSLVCIDKNENEDIKVHKYEDYSQLQFEYSEHFYNQRIDDEFEN